MNVQISTLTIDYLEEVDRLMKNNSSTLGFLPFKALEGYLEKGGVLGAVFNGTELAGYLLYGVNPECFRIAQLCVAEDFRGQGLARKLVSALRRSAETQRFIRLTCRRDFSASSMWPKLGFTPVIEKPGRSSGKLPLTVWHSLISRDSQLDIFQGKVSDTALDVAIDAHIFFNFDGPENDHNTQLSKALLEDFLADAVQLWITDELRVEINRNENENQRRISFERTRDFPTVEYDSMAYEEFRIRLSQILPHRTQSQQSDVRHLAMAAASDVKTFLTQDQPLLNRADEILKVAGIQVLSPTALIIRFHELSNRSSYVPERISGRLSWKRITHGALRDLTLDPFLDVGERKGLFREWLEFFLSRPNQYESQFLFSGDTVCAIWISEVGNNSLSVHLARVAAFENPSLYEMLLVSETIQEIAKRRLGMAVFKANAITGNLFPHLFKAGFKKMGDDYARFSFPHISSRPQALEKISARYPECRNVAEGMPDTELEQYCSPLTLDPASQSCFLIPIKSGYAISLFDREQASAELFGGEANILLRWENVYYRAKTHHHKLKEPARLLWYVSGNDQQVVAVSQLDQVTVGSPKALFKEFKKFGILEWKEIFELCRHDISTEIMALKFSHTFPFSNPVPLAQVQSIFKEHGKRLSLQSPLEVPFGIYRELFRRGFSN